MSGSYISIIDFSYLNILQPIYKNKIYYLYIMNHNKFDTLIMTISLIFTILLIYIYTLKTILATNAVIILIATFMLYVAIYTIESFIL